MGLQHFLKFNGGCVYKKSDIAYVAGVFDIHGSIKIIADKDDLPKSSLYVWITSKDAKLMKFLELLFYRLELTLYNINQSNYSIPN